MLAIYAILQPARKARIELAIAIAIYSYILEPAIGIICNCMVYLGQVVVGLIDSGQAEVGVEVEVVQLQTIQHTQ